MEETGRRIVVGQRRPADGDPKKRMEHVEQRRDVALVMAEHGLGEHQVCELRGLDRTTYHYEPRPDGNFGLGQAILELALRRFCSGYQRLGALLARLGWPANPRRVYRLNRQEQRVVRRPKRKR